MRKKIFVKNNYFLFKKELLSLTKKKKKPASERAKHPRRQMTGSDSDSDWVIQCYC